MIEKEQNTYVEYKDYIIEPSNVWYRVYHKNLKPLKGMNSFYSLSQTFDTIEECVSYIDSEISRVKNMKITEAKKLKEAKNYLEKLNVQQTET